jgi:zinc protease
MLKKKVCVLLLSICFAVVVFFNVCFTANAKEPKSISLRKEEKSGDNLDKVPVRGKIVDEKIDDRNTIIWTLSNGVKVVLKCQDPHRANRVSSDIEMIAVAKGSILNVAKEDIVSAKIATLFLNKDIDDGYSEELVGISGKEFCFHGNQFMRSFCLNNNIGTRNLFELMHRVFTNYKIDSKKLKLFVAMQKAKLEYEQYANSFQLKYLKERKKIVHNNDPYFKPLESYDFSKFNKNKVLKLIKNMLNPADYTFVFVGNIDVNTFREYVEIYLASISKREEESTSPQEYNVSFAGQVTSKIYINPQNIYNGEIYIIIRKTYLPKNRLLASFLIEYLYEIYNRGVGKNHSSINWYDNIEKKEYFLGADSMYSISFYCDARKLDGNAATAIEFIDENIATLTACIKEIAAGNINIGLFNKNKKILKSRYTGELKYNSVVVREYANAIIYDRPLADIYKIEKICDDTTPKDLQEVAAKILQEGIFTILGYPKDYKNKDGNIQ